MIQQLLKDYSSVIIIGSDIPALDHSLVEEAFSVLEDHDVVLGPCHDGGYYLIGMKQSHDLFSGITWSSSSVFSDSKKKCKELGLTLGVLQTLDDVDTLSDYEKIKNTFS